ncbi:MAG: hypothetical protein JWL66_2651 [Sphingomonadales bacterium]|nr:hypothetical protein [Sphingomonadales bacterium]
MAMASANSAWAAGGAHVVDDSEVETPGSCHVETSVARLQANAALAVISPACTPELLPNLELGFSAAYNATTGHTNLAIGPAIKWQLRSSSSGLGFAIDASLAWGSANHRIENASFIVPISVPLGEGLTANLDAGTVWARADVRAAGFLGAQLVWQERTDLGLMMETFDRTGGAVGVQSGVRWNPNPNTDFDLLVSHEFDGSAHANATVGLTKRF